MSERVVYAYCIKHVNGRSQTVSGCGQVCSLVMCYQYCCTFHCFITMLCSTVDVLVLIVHNTL